MTGGELARTIGPIAIIAVVSILGFEGYYPVMLAMIQDFSEDGSSAANGVFMMISFLARSAVVVLVGFLADRFGLENSSIFRAIIGCMAIPFVLRLKKKARTP